MNTRSSANQARKLKHQSIKNCDRPTSRRGRQKNLARRPRFEFASHFKETHGKPIHAVEFCNNLKAGEPTIFCTCGSNFLSIYECQNDGEIKLVQTYSDAIGDEEYYACCWSFDPTTTEPILAVGGLNKTIRIIYPTTATSNTRLIGHGDAINDLKFHPKNPSVLLSASKDHSIRLWNVRSDVCIAIFGGADGHMAGVLSCDFDASGNRIVTSGLDKSVNIWNLNKLSIQRAIQASFSVDQNEKRWTFKTVIERFPDHSVDHIHSNYVDCVQWMGDLIFSKSKNSIVCWKPGYLGDMFFGSNSTSSVLYSYEYGVGGGPFCRFRFSFDISYTYMAVGDANGTTLLWQIDENEIIRLAHGLCTGQVLATAFSHDSKILISVCDDGTVWKWHRVDAIV